MARRFARFSGCHQRRLATITARPGRLDVQFVVRADGTVADLHAAASSLADPELTSCLLAAFDDLSFPAQEGGPTRVRYPLFVQPGTAPDGSGDPPRPASQRQVAGLASSEWHGDHS